MNEASRTVLVVDDDPAVLDSLCAVLESHGFEARPFASAQRLLDEIGDAPHGCIILDYALPDLDGLQVLRKLAARGVKTPLVIITGRANARIREAALRAGAAAFLEKPFPASELLKLVNAALRSNA